MTEADLALARTWIGRTVTIEDVLTPQLVRTFHATLDPHLAPAKPGEAPLGIHWCLGVETAAMADLDADGHPRRGGFLPPCPLPRRMAAGGDVTISAPLRIGAKITRTSSIKDVALREGRTGQLCFVTVEHAFACDGAPALIETQRLVFREADSAAAPPKPADAPPPAAAPEKADISRVADANPALLFRFSALTFNTHRIHYDREYARQAEGYPGLLVHGPLQGTLLLNLAAQLLGRAPTRFDFRAEAPAFDGPVGVAGRLEEGKAICWTSGGAGARAMSGTGA